jgi:hypothetical protein
MDKYLDDIKKFKEFKEKEISTNRIQYMMMNYTDSLFPGELAPSWYHNVKGTFEIINVIDNTIVRIVRNNLGNYRLYCKVASSDTWDEIKNVPQEIRYVINALMYTPQGINKGIIEKRFKDTMDKMDDILDGNYDEIE